MAFLYPRKGGKQALFQVTEPLKLRTQDNTVERWKENSENKITTKEANMPKEIKINEENEVKIRHIIMSMW